jgi:hypothetical protein
VKRPPVLVYLVTEDWYFVSHRLPMARAARDAGYEVHVLTNVREHGAAIRDENFHLHPLQWRRGSFNPANLLAISNVCGVDELAACSLTWPSFSLSCRFLLPRPTSSTQLSANGRILFQLVPRGHGHIIGRCHCPVVQWFSATP